MLKYNSLKKGGVTPFLTEHSDIDKDGLITKYLSNEHWMVPAKEVAGIPMDIEVKTIRNIGRLLPKHETSPDGFEMFVKTKLVVETEKASYAIFESDRVGTPSNKRRYLTLNKTYVDMFGIELTWKTDDPCSPAEFPVGNSWGVIMACSDVIGEKVLSPVTAVIESLFPGVLEAETKSAVTGVEELESKHVETIKKLEAEIAALQKAKVEFCAEEHVKSWPKAIFPVLDGPTMAEKVHNTSDPLNDIGSLVRHLKMNMPGDREVFIAYYVNQNNQIINAVIESTGTQDQTAVYPREVIRQCLKHGATGIFVSHNHPTGALRPSESDRNITKALASACSAVDIRFLDHVIIGTEGIGYFSFRENGLIR
jgi:DNA repair protein RadC